MALPPGPRTPWPLQARQLLRDPIGFHERLHQRYGPVAHARFISGEHAAFIMDPKLARKVLMSDPGSSCAGVARARFLEPLIGSHTLFTLDGERWRRHRTMLGGAFHSSRVDEYTEQITEITRAEVATWRPGEMALDRAMTGITLAVILRCVFGVSDPGRYAALTDLLPRMLDAAPVFAFLPPVVRDGVRGAVARGIPSAVVPGGRFARLRAEVDRVLIEEIAARRLEPDLDERNDTLSALIVARDDEGVGLSDEELRDELLSLLVAGYETTGSSLCWAFERLVQHPDAMAGVQAGLEAGDDTYLRAVVQETLRYRAVGHIVNRVPAGPYSIGGYDIPEHWHLAVSTAAIHCDAASWPDPHEFRPERFLEGRPTMTAWIPFGGGRRYCAGAPLALVEMRAVIGEVVRSIDLEPPAEREATRIKHVVVQPSRGGRVTVRGPRAVGGVGAL